MTKSATMYRPTWKSDDKKWCGFKPELVQAGGWYSERRGNLSDSIDRRRRGPRTFNRRNFLRGGMAVTSATILAQTAAADTVFTTFPYAATGGSATRTTPDRLADVRNVLDFSADASGVGDSSAAFRAACAAAGSTNIGEVFVPPGTYTGVSEVYFNSGFSHAGFTDSTAVGFYVGSRTTNILVTEYKDGVSKATDTNNTLFAPIAGNIYILALNNTGLGTASNGFGNTLKQASIGAGLTGAQVTSFNARVVAW